MATESPENGMTRERQPTRASSKEKHWLERTEMLLGENGIRALARARVYVFGLGAVGSYAVEGLARAGVGYLRLVDFDRFKMSDINRQLYALHSTVGMFKTEAAARRVRDINPFAAVEPVTEFAHADTLPALLDGGPDLVIDAVDSLNPKVEIIARAAGLNIPVFSAFGAATRTDASRIRFSPLFSAEGCPLGRLVKKRLRKKGVQGDLWCVHSEERQNKDAIGQPDMEDGDYERGRRRMALGSLPTLTAIFGLRLAHEAIMRITAGSRVGSSAFKEIGPTAARFP